MTVNQGDPHAQTLEKLALEFRKYAEIVAPRDYVPSDEELADDRRYHIEKAEALEAGAACLRRAGPQTALPNIEITSAKVHEAWIASKAAQGVTSRKAEDGEELIAPYEVLSEKAKELDRGTVRAVYAAIREAQHG